jgi:alpha-1,3-rhamnosyl/mannosyltransferase
VPSGITIPDERDRDPDIVTKVRERYGLDDLRILLYPAITYPHKNHLMLIDAFRGVIDDVPDAALVLTGGEARLEGDVLEAVRRHDLDERVFRLGRIPRSDLDALYRTAVCLTFPSRFEGFGIPVLEAMSRGCPVVAADSTALPEVVGDAGLLVAPRDVSGWTTAMIRLLEDDGLRAELAGRGLVRAAAFDWQRPAAALESVYRAALAEP